MFTRGQECFVDPRGMEECPVLLDKPLIIAINLTAEIKTPIRRSRIMAFWL